MAETHARVDLDRAQLERELGRDEGRRATVYFDTRGVPTIGVGHNLYVPLSDAVIDAIFNDDVNSAMAGLDAHWPFWRSLDGVRQRVVVNMVFNLGIDGFMAFKQTRAAIEAGEWATAANRMWASRWARQVGDGPGKVQDRADRLTAMMATGREPQ